MSTYHQRVASEKRALIVRSATALFLRQGYERTSLAQVAEASGVSKATLFKQFPTKAALFGAIVTSSWSATENEAVHETGDFESDPTTHGRHYATLLHSADMADLYRIVIAERPHFPELAEIQFTTGKLPYYETVRSYLERVDDAGLADIDDTEMATTQFMGMIANVILWPKLLLPAWDVSEAKLEAVVAEAVATMLSRYAAPHS